MTTTKLALYVSTLVNHVYVYTYKYKDAISIATSILVALISCLYLTRRGRRGAGGKDHLNLNLDPNLLPVPYSCFAHPDKCFADKVLGLIFAKFLPISSLANLTNTFTCRYGYEGEGGVGEGGVGEGEGEKDADVDIDVKENPAQTARMRKRTKMRKK